MYLQNCPDAYLAQIRRQTEPLANVQIRAKSVQFSRFYGLRRIVFPRYFSASRISPAYLSGVELRSFWMNTRLPAVFIPAAWCTTTQR